MGIVIPISRMENPRHSGPEADWFEGIGFIARRVLDLKVITEEGFLAIGRNLEDFSARSAQIAKISTSASSVMGGDEILGAIDGLRRMLLQLEELFGQTEDASRSSLETLRLVRRMLVEVREELNGLQDTAKTLKMLGLSTKIQSTHTGRGLSVFMQLGTEIAELSGIISGKSTELLGNSTDLAAFVDDVLGKLGTLRGNQETQIRKVLAGTGNIVDSLGRLSEKSVGETSRIKARTGEISRHISELVTSIQYQDITTQSLTKIRQSLTAPWAPASPVPKRPETELQDSKSDLIYEGIAAAGTCMRQAVCLRSVGEEACRAILDIIGGLRNISHGIGEMSTLAGSASRDSSRFLEELEVGMSSITSFLSDVVQSSKEMSLAMSSLATTIEGMTQFTDDIEMISSEVELISLNARILASQTGRDGAGMNVIAGAIQETAGDSEKQRRSLVEKLGAIACSAVELRNEIETTSEGGEKKLDQLVRELGVFLDALRIMQRNVVRMLGDIDTKSRDLHEDISSAVKQIQIHDRVEKEIREVTDVMVDVAEKICGRIPPGELHVLTQGKRSFQEILAMDVSQRVEIAEEYTRREDERCFDDRTGADDVVLFEDE